MVQGGQAASLAGSRIWKNHQCGTGSVCKMQGWRCCGILNHSFRESLRPANVLQGWSPHKEALRGHGVELWGEVYIMIKIPGYWWYLDHGISAEKSYRHKGQGAWEKRLCSHRQRSYLGRLSNPFDPIWFHSPKMVDMKLQDLMFALPSFGLASFWSFFAMPPFLPFEMRLCVLCHCMLEVC